MASYMSSDLGPETVQVAPMNQILERCVSLDANSLSLAITSLNAPFEVLHSTSKYEEFHRQLKPCLKILNHLRLSDPNYLSTEHYHGTEPHSQKLVDKQQPNTVELTLFNSSLTYQIITLDESRLHLVSDRFQIFVEFTPRYNVIGVLEDGKSELAALGLGSKLLIFLKTLMKKHQILFTFLSLN